MGRAADSHNRKLIIALGCLIWSLATAGMGSSSAFWSLLTFRLLLGLGAAFSNPASYSMIADLFPPDQRPMANGTLNAYAILCVLVYCCNSKKRKRKVKVETEVFHMLPQCPPFIRS